MLVLSRKKDQEIVINHDIVIVVLEIRAGVVRLGIKAPREVPIYREELIRDFAAHGKPADRQDGGRRSMTEEQLSKALTEVNAKLCHGS